jgi:hypothetical protein
MIHVAALRLLQFCLRQMAGCDFSPSACIFITHPEGIAKSVSQQLDWGCGLNVFCCRKQVNLKRAGCRFQIVEL